MKQKFQNFVDGAWVDGRGTALAVVDPSNGEQLALQEMANAQDVDSAVQAAGRCHRSGALSDLRPCERARMVRAMGEYLEDHQDEVARLLSLEAGKPIWESRIEVAGTARFFEYYGSIAEALEGKSIPLGAAYIDFTILEPYGVTAHIIPWNFPLEMIARSTAAALAAGNTCVVKTPELTPLSAKFIAEASIAADLPKGAFNLLCGYGAEAGVALSSHPGVDQIVFTGSVPTGIAVGRAAAENVIPAVLELGGKSAAIVYPDADASKLMESVRWGIFYNSGQVCSAMSRLLVHRSIYDQIVDDVVEMARGLSLARIPAEENSDSFMGTLVSTQQRDRVLDMSRAAEKDRARLAIGGTAPNLPGAYLNPTVFVDVDPSAPIAQEEIFGPVLSVTPFDDDVEAAAIANGTPFGLVGGVFTGDLDRAMRTARKLRAGQVFVNEWYAGGVETPFGGVGKSGIGREKGFEGLMNYVRTKNIAIAGS